MANCEISIDKYVSIVENLIKLDPSKYNNFDETAQFILKSGLTNGEKYLSINNIASIYAGLHGLDPAFYAIGNAEKVFDINSMEPDDFISVVSKFYNTKKPTPLKADAIQSKIDGLGSLPYVTRQDLVGPDGILTLMKNYFNTTVFENLDERNEALKQFTLSLNEIIRELNTTDAQKDLLLKAVEDVVGTLDKKSQFIALQDIESLAQLNTVLVTMNNGQMIEAVNRPQGLVQVDEFGNEDKINMEEVASTREARRKDGSNTNRGEQEFTEDTLTSNFQIQPVEPTPFGVENIQTKINSMKNPSVGIKIHAVRLSSVGDERLNRIHDLAQNDPQYAALANRTFETFENETQVKFLKSTSNGTVLTVSRPKLSEDKFALIGEIISTGEKFYLHSLSNFVFLNSDNTTERVDFSNDAHLEKVKEHSLLRTEDGLQSLEASDLEKLKNSYSEYQKFKNAIEDVLAKSLTEGQTSMDISSLFYSQYEIGKKTFGKVTKESLAKSVESDKSLSRPLTIVKFNEDGTVASEEVRNIPFMFVKLTDKRSDADKAKGNPAPQFELRPLLNKDERIKITDADGKVIDYVSQVDYVKDGHLAPGVDFNDNFIKETLFKNLELNYRYAHHIIVRFNNNGSFGWREVEPQLHFSEMQGFATFMTNISAIIGSTNKRSLLINFNKDVYSFKRLTTQTGEAGLYVNFATDKRGNLQVEIRPAAVIENGVKKYKYGFIESNKSDFNFTFDYQDAEGNMKSFDENLYKIGIALKSGPTVKQVIKENPIFSELDLNKQSDVIKFYTMLNQLSKDTNASPAVQALATVIDQYQEEFTDYLIKRVVEPLKATMNSDKYAQYKEMFNEDFPNPEFLVATSNDEGKVVPRIEYSPNNKSQEKQDFLTNLDNIQLKSIPVSKTVITSKTNSSPSVATQKIQDTTKPLEQTQHPIENKPIGIAEKPVADPNAPVQETKVNNNEIEDEDVFSIFESPVETESEKERQTAIDLLGEILPQFGISKTDISEIVDLSKIDGTVLGLFKDKVIYLNDQLKSKGVVFHEAFHGVFRYLLTDDIRAALVNQVVSNKKNAKLFTPAALKEFADKRNYLYNYEKMKQLQAEEILADGFQNYMNKGTKPKGLLAVLHELLKKLIALFSKHGNAIDNLYGDIRSGTYSQKAISSNIYDGQVAYEMIYGLKEIKPKTDGVGSSATISTLVTSQQNQLEHMMTLYIVQDTSGKTFEEKFENARQLLLKNVYNMDNIIRQNPALKEVAEKEYGNLYAQYRFMLGARMDGETVHDINLTGNPDNNGKMLDNKVDTYDGKGIQDNSMGQVSLETLKKLVKQRVRSIYSILDGVGVKAIDKETINNELSGDNEFKSQEENDFEDDQEVTAEINTDESFNEHNRLESAPRQLRRFLAIVEYEKIDKNGFRTPRVIDGEAIFGSLLKICSDIEPGKIINQMQDIANVYRENGKTDDANDLQAVYDKLVKYTAMDENGNPATNKQLYNMFINVLHGTEIGYMLVSPKLSFDATGESSITDFTIKDQILSQDLKKKKSDLITSMITTHTKLRNDPEYQEAVKQLLEIANSIVKDDMIITKHLQANAQLEELTEKLHNAFKTVGFDLTKSLIRTSILAIDKVDNGNKQLQYIDEKTINHYENNKVFVAENSLLEKDFFRDIREIFKDVTSDPKTAISANGFAKMLDDSNANLNRFQNIVGRFSKYLLKYDATGLPPVIKNAAGKSCYRYTKYTPLILTAQSLRREGLEQTLAKDPYYADFLETYYQDNSWFGDLLNGKDTLKARQAKLLMENMKVDLFGGVTQMEGQSFREGKVFGKLDDQSLYLSSIFAFLQRKTYGTKEEGIQTFSRMFSTLESSQTSFLVTGLYQQYANTTGLLKNGSYYKIVDELEANVKQEYNRIKKEAARVGELKKEFDAGSSNTLINKYNAVLDSNDKTKANVEKEGLRAFNFNSLPDFFEDADNQDLRKALIDAAKAGVAYEDIDPSDIKDLKTALHNHADNKLNAFYDELIKLNVINKEEKVRTKIVRDKATGKPLLNEVGNPIVEEMKNALGQPTAPVRYLTSKLIADKLKIDNTGAQVASDYYARSEQMYNEIGMPMTMDNLEGLLADFFFNYWANALNVNEIFDGDLAMNVASADDYIKRNKKLLASGDNLKEGFHTAAYLNTIEGYIDEKFPQYGPYYSQKEITDDKKLSAEEREYLTENFKVRKSDIYEIFDGQAVSTLMHQIDMHDSQGRLSPQTLYSLISKHYRNLTEAEVREMEKNKIVNNPKKTVVAAKNSYHKDSEAYIDRNDVSRLIIPEGVDIEDIYDELHGMYVDIYDKRTEIQQRYKIGDQSRIKELQSEIQDIYKVIHTYYEPLPHRVKLHNLLNSMEFHNIDQLMDTTSSKQATKLPVDYFAHENNPSGYLPLDLSSVRVNNEDKYIQVETSGVHDTARFSVQGKILLPADIANIKEIAERRHLEAGTEMSESEKDAMNNLTGILNQYQESLFDISNSNLQSLKSLMRKGGDFEMGKIFNLIRENLEAQKAPMSALSLFAVDASGKPVHSPNLPGIRSMLEYYFFSVYSKHVTDERGSGFKNIHISSFGYNVLEDADGNVVTTEEYSNNPEKYLNITSRPLGVKVEEGVDKNGNTVTKYFVECILPKNFFKSEQHEEFYKKNLTEMFALRIPTEDKRSMIALKVVDYIDSSNLNGIIVPHFVHLLAGSDFDIDSLYGQTFAHYVNADGVYNKYGNYENYMSENQGKYMEYLHYMMGDENFSDLIKQRKRNLSAEGEFTPSANTLDALYMMGYTQEDYIHAFSGEYFKNLEDEDDRLTSDIDQLSADRNVDKQEYVDWLHRTEDNPDDQNAWRNRKFYGATIADQLTKIKANQQQRKDVRSEKNKLKDFVYTALKIEAAMQVFDSYGLPLNIDEFERNPIYGMAVLPIHQNNNLQAKLDLLTNEAVFNNLYIHERSSVKVYEDLCDDFGRPLSEFNKGVDHHTISSVVHYKRSGSSYKDGIGIAASIQKFLALASQYQLELNDKNVIWKFMAEEKDSDGGVKINKNNLFRFGSVNANGQRVIELNGNILGMFADGMKKPIPAALGLNEINTGVTLAMIGVGVTPEMAIAFNFLPEVQNAVRSVQTSRFAISDTMQDGVKFLNGEVQQQIMKYLNDSPDKTILSELKEAGLLTPDSKPFKLELIKDNLMINFEPKKIGQREDVTPGEIGFEVSAYNAGVKTTLSEGAQKIVLLELYRQQASQAWNIRSAGAVVDLFKKLNPSFTSFDRLYKNINDLRNGETIFTPESSEKLFSGKQPWVPLTEAMDDLHQQAGLIFLERTKFFQPIKNAFDSVYTDPANIAKTIVSFIALTKYRTTMPGSRKSTNAVMEANFREDDANLQRTFTADYWFENTLAKEIEQLKEKYPENKFLQFVAESHSTITAKDVSGKLIGEKSLQLVSKSKIKGTLADDISNDAYNLMFKENMFMKKLFYHELARTGMSYKNGSFLQYLPANLQLPLSQNITEFITKLEDTNGSPREVIDTIKDFMQHDDVVSDDDVYNMFDQLFTLMAYGASKEVGNKKIKEIKAVSFYEENETKRSNFMALLETEEKLKYKVANEILSKFFDRDKSYFTGNKKFTFDAKVFGNDFIIDMKKDLGMKEATPDLIAAIGATMKIARDKEETEKFKFPIMIKMENGTYLLQGVDNEIGNKSIGKSIINSIAGVGEYKTVGFEAQYVLIPSELTTGTLNPIGFDVKESQRFMDLTTKKAELNIDSSLEQDSDEDWTNITNESDDPFTC